MRPFVHEPMKATSMRVPASGSPGRGHEPSASACARSSAFVREARDRLVHAAGLAG
jgi:hypothetical protein